MAGGANPNMVQPTANPFMRASTANQQALNTYSNPGAAAASMMNPYNQQVVDTTLRDVGQASQIAMNNLHTDSQASTVLNTTIPAGTVLFLNITGITLTSGVAVGYIN